MKIPGLTYEDILILMDLVKAEYNKATPGIHILQMCKKYNVPIDENFPAVAMYDKLYTKLQEIQIVMSGGKVLE